MFGQITKEVSLQKAIEVFSVAKRKSAFYAEKYQALDSISSYEDWLKVPILSKDELFNNSYPKSTRMLTLDLPLKEAIITSTGGSAGLARYTMLTYTEWDKFLERQAEALRLIGIHEEDVVANLFVAGSLWPSFVALHDNIRLIGATHLPISANIEFDKMLRYIMEFKPTVLLSLPTVFVILADMILQQNLKVDFVKLIGYAGEHMSEMIRNHLKKAFPGVRIESLAYTSADCGLIGYQCDECASSEYHLPTDFQFVEIYNFEENRVCEPGETGEVLITNLERLSQPIIRYRIGDVAQWTDKKCACGDKNPVFIIEGRAGDDFKIGGAYISMVVVEKSFSEFVSTHGISANYQFELEDISDAKLNIVLKIESSDIKNSREVTEKIHENIKTNINDIKVGEEMGLVIFNVEFVKLGALPRSPITGKVKRLNDIRVKGDK
ncbi:MAG: phenylacetate--CoA ligase family protein [Bacteroidales bacterium]|nr:phenylacetate--CoA ligase family protein [Bacteroidales bacterium]